MTRPMPEHGTRARYLRGCHCAPCGQAHRDYCKSYRSRKAPYAGGLVPADRAARLVRELNEHGWSQDQIATATHVSPTIINSLVHGIHPKITLRNNRKVINTAPRLLGTAPPQAPINATGTARRLQALAVMGHPIYTVANEIGAPVDRLQDIAKGADSHVRPDIAASVARLYRQWIRRPGPSAVAQGIARKRGWHGPLAWDDNIDDPNALPDTDNNDRRLNKQEEAVIRRGEILHLAAFRFTPDEIATKTGLSSSYISAQIKGERKPGWRKEKETAA